MKISITYAELQDYVASHFHKTVNLGYVDGATVSVSVPIKVYGAQNETYMSRSAEKWVKGLCFNELGVGG